MAMTETPFYTGRIDPNDVNDPRSRIVNLTPPASYVLEVGCGAGSIIGHLATAKGCRTLAVEPDARMAAAARAAGIEVIEGEIDDPTIQSSLAARGPFDVIIFADVLEHLVDPWQVLGVVRDWLTPGGSVLASIPNVAHWSIRLQLLRGQWNYTHGYLMDSTHLRWFTLETARQLFTSTGYRVDDLQVRWAPLPGDRLWRRLFPQRAVFYEALARRVPGLFGYQFVVQARP